MISSEDFPLGLQCDAEFQRVGNDVFVPDDIFPADVAIVFGMTTWRRPVDRALELYRSGYARTLLFTGGYNHKIDAVEATEMADAASRDGVPSAAILIEDKAANTAENLIFAQRRLLAHRGLESVDSILLVAIEFHMRRVLMTAQRILAPDIRLGAVSYPSAFYSREAWFASERGHRDVASEIEKIRLYLDPDWRGVAP